ncbi:hypothetical protein ACHAXT_003450 [Thalassiosira profunda]
MGPALRPIAGAIGGGDEGSDEDDSTQRDEEGPLLRPLPATVDGGDKQNSPSGKGGRPQDYRPLSIEGGDAAVTEDPHAAGLGGSLPSAALGIVKGMVGPAILYLPHGFASAGYLVAIPVLMLSTSLFLWSSGCLLECWRSESERINKRRLDGGRVRLSYPELAYCAFGSTGERLVQVGISLMQSGVCLTYLIFVPQNLRASTLLLLGWDVSTTWMLLFMVLIQIPLSWIRDIRRLTVTNLLANILISYGLLICLGFAADSMVAERTEESFLQEAIHRAEALPAFNPSGWFLFLGTSVLLFEGSITLLVPLQEAVQTDSDRRTFPTMYRRVILSIVSFYAFFGMTCWMAFGNEVRTVMTTSLPPGTMATTVQLAYSLAVVFTFPLQNFPSLEIVCNLVEQMVGGGDKHDRDGLGNWRRNAVASTLIVALSIVALLTMDDLDKVVSLMGSLLGIPLAFVLPPLIQNQLGKGHVQEVNQCMNIAVATLGAAAMAVSSTTTILNWE